MLFPRFTLFSAMLLLTSACATTKTVTSTSKIGDNNVVSTQTKNSRFSASKTDGEDKLIIKGKNNLINIVITDSDIASFNTKTVTIVEGDNNNLSSLTRKCVLVYKDRTDTLIIKGNKLKIDFTADDLQALIDGPDQKQEITQGQSIQEFLWTDWHGGMEPNEGNSMYIEELNMNLKPAEAFGYYREQAHKGNYSAFFMLGRFFDNLTFDTKADFAKAIPYYEMAARNNNVDAALRLGYIYEVGDFEFDKMPVDHAKAEYYYTLAAKNGSEKAKEKLALWKH